ncbi:MAG: hypothetical protein RLZZ387_4879 [Chloroflexota bacterium]
MEAGQTAADLYVLCHVGGAVYAIPARSVRHAELVPAIARLPDAPPYVEGVAIVRGHVLAVVSLRLRLGLPSQPHDMRARLVVVRHGEHAAALLVDSAREFLRIPAEVVQPAPEGLGEPGTGFLAGVARLGERLILILRVDAILGELAHSAPAGATV